MDEISSSDIRIAFGDIVERLQRGEVFRLQRYGRDLALIVPLNVAAQGLTPLADIQEAAQLLGPLLSRSEG